jgi:hypothetical protein
LFEFRSPLPDRTHQLIGLAAIVRDGAKCFEEMRALKRMLADATKVSR